MRLLDLRGPTELRRSTSVRVGSTFSLKDSVHTLYPVLSCTSSKILKVPFQPFEVCDRSVLSAPWPNRTIADYHLAVVSHLTFCTQCILSLTDNYTFCSRICWIFASVQLDDLGG